MVPDSVPMTDDSVPAWRWRFRLQVITGLALLVLLVMALRARSARSDILDRREAVAGALRQLVLAQEEHYARHGRFATVLDSALAFRAPPSVIVTLRAEGDQSWRAIATDSALVVAPTTCGVFLGDQSAAPHRAVLEPGVVACW